MSSTANPKVVRVPRRIPRPARRPVPWPLVRLTMLAFSAIAVIALTVDLVSIRLRADRSFSESGESHLVSDALIEIATATNRYVDFAGRFSLPHPPSWAAYPYRNEGDYDVTMRGPHRMEVSVMTRPISAPDMNTIRERIVENEARARIRTDIEEVTFQNRPALRRVVQLRTISIEALDFIAGSLHVHIAASAPRNAFDDLRPALHAMVEGVRIPPGAAQE